MYKIALFILTLIFVGCSSKTEFNSLENDLTAKELHSKLIKAVQKSNLDEADNLLLSIEANHPTSFFIKDDILILYFAHLKNEEFKLAKFYLNELEKRYASNIEIPWCEYQKIRVDFLSYQNAYTDEGKILDILDSCKKYKKNFPNSKFTPEVNTLYVKTLLTKMFLDDKINKLYKRLDKPKAAKKYKVNIPNDAKTPYIPWYKKLFYW